MAESYIPGHLSVLYKEQNDAKRLCTNDKLTKSMDEIKPNLFIESVELKIQILGENSTCDLSSVNAMLKAWGQIITSEISTLNDLEIILTSPKGSEFSQKITHSEVLDIISGNPLKLYTHNFYGEKSEGEWTITFIDNSTRIALPFGWLLTIYGTKTDISKTPTPDPNQTIN